MASAYKWTKTDTAAIMFTSLEKKDSSRVFRSSIVLKDEDVDKDRLQKAAEKTLKLLPTLSVRHKKGFFWGYLEHIDCKPIVCEETNDVAKPRSLSMGEQPAIRFMYYKRRISIEFSHTLTDGAGAGEFIKTLMACYFGKETAEIQNDTDFFSKEEGENAFKRYYSKDADNSKKKSNKAHVISNISPNKEIDYIFGFAKTDDVKEKAKLRSLTITEYLTCVLIYSIITSSKKKINDDIIISVPVNLRKIFPSDTLRNFSGEVPVKYTVKGENDTFDDVCNAVRGQIAAQTTKENIQRFINSTYSLTVNPVLRVVPFAIKQKVLDASQKKSHMTSQSTILTNLGKIDFGEEINSKIERVDCVSGDLRIYGLSLTISVVTFNGYLNICFNSSLEDRDLGKDYYRFLQRDGIDLYVESNRANGYDEKQKSENAKCCKNCGVLLAREYTVCPLCSGKAEESDTDVPFKTAPYPEKSTVSNKDAIPPAKRVPLSKEKIKAYFNI